MDMLDIYDIVQLKDGSKVEILQVRPDTILALPTEGGIPKTYPIADFEGCEILSSTVKELKGFTLTEKWARMISLAKERWHQHSSTIKPKRASSGSRKVNVGPILPPGLDDI